MAGELTATGNCGDDAQAVARGLLATALDRAGLKRPS
jgi:hypothetical protein